MFSIIGFGHYICRPYYNAMTKQPLAALIMVLIFQITLTSCNQQTKPTEEKPFDSTTAILFPGETHLKNVKQLTFGGDNAEAYWSFSGKQLTFQRTDHKQIMCDQIFMGNVPFDSSGIFNFNMISSGKGRTTCSYFLPGDSLILYASTAGNSDECPPTPDREKLKKYVWIEIFLILIFKKNIFMEL